MKNLILFIGSLFIVFCLYGQKPEGESRESEIRTLFGARKGSYGGYGGLGAAYSLIDDKAGFVTSGRGALIIDHSLAIGFAGVGFINDFHYNSALESDVNLTGGYGGILIEPIIFGKMPAHLSVPLIAGVGGIAYTRNNIRQSGYERWDSYVEDSDVYLVAEPGLELEFNVLRFFRVSLVASYRFTSVIRLMDTPGNALEGFSTGFNLKFGKF